MRLKILCEDRCEDIAVNLAAACVRSLRRSDQLRSLSESHHVHYMIDVYIVLLYKLKRTQDIFAQVSTDRISHNQIIECPVALAWSRTSRVEDRHGMRESICRFRNLVPQIARTFGFDSIRRSDASDIHPGNEIIRDINSLRRISSVRRPIRLTFQGSFALKRGDDREYISDQI